MCIVEILIFCYDYKHLPFSNKPQGGAHAMHITLEILRSGEIKLPTLAMPIQMQKLKRWIKEFAIEGVRHQMGISNNKAEGFGDPFKSQSFGLCGV